MRRLLISFVAFLMVSIASFAQSKTHVELVIDYSKADIMGFTEDEIMAFEFAWEDQKATFWRYFAHGFNSEIESSNVVAGHFDQPDYIMIVDVVRIEDDGDMVVNMKMESHGGVAVMNLNHVTSLNRNYDINDDGWNGSRSPKMLDTIAVGMYSAGKQVGSRTRGRK